MFFSPIYRLVMARVRQRIREAEAAYRQGRKDLKAKLKEDEADLADKLVSHIVKF